MNTSANQFWLSCEHILGCVLIPAAILVGIIIYYKIKK
jgi:hypothetical protein